MKLRLLLRSVVSASNLMDHGWASKFIVGKVRWINIWNVVRTCCYRFRLRREIFGGRTNIGFKQTWSSSHTRQCLTFYDWLMSTKRWLKFGKTNVYLPAWWNGINWNCCKWEFLIDERKQLLKDCQLQFLSMRITWPKLKIQIKSGPFTFDK